MLADRASLHRNIYNMLYTYFSSPLLSIIVSMLPRHHAQRWQMEVKNSQTHRIDGQAKRERRRSSCNNQRSCK